MPKSLKILTAAAAFLLVMTACTSGSGGSDSTIPTTGDPGSTTTVSDGSTTTTASVVEDVSLVLWVDDAHAAAIETAAAAFETATGATVEVEAMPFFDIRGAVMDAIPAGQGPDLFLDSNEGTGALAEAGLIAPLDLGGREEGFVPVAIDAFSYEGAVYGMPVVFEAVGLFYNKSLVPEPPADFDALLAACDGLGYPAADDAPCLAIPAGQSLHQFPFVGGFGGYVFGFENGTHNVTDVGLDTPGAVAGAAFLEGLYRNGYAESTVDYPAMADLFNQGAVPFMWTGPWQTGAVNSAGIDYGVVKLPLMEGNSPRPFVGATGFFLNALSESSMPAVSLLMDYIATTETIGLLAEATGRPPALKSSLDLIAPESNLAAFAESGIDGVPLPNVPEMRAVWGPLDAAFAAISRGSADPAAAMTEAADLIRTGIGSG